MKWRADNLMALEKVAHYALEQAIEKAASTKAAVLALHGNLGAGKTAFTKSIAKILGITATITSPTFVIQKSFDMPADHVGKYGAIKKLIHIDTYRIDLQDELVKLGWRENVADAGNLIAVEWPENIPDLLPRETVHVYFEFINETTREIEIR